MKCNGNEERKPLGLEGKGRKTENSHREGEPGLEPAGGGVDDEDLWVGRGWVYVGRRG